MEFCGNCHPGDALSCHASEPDLLNDSCVCHKGDVRKCKSMAMTPNAGFHMKLPSESDVGSGMQDIGFISFLVSCVSVYMCV